MSKSVIELVADELLVRRAHAGDSSAFAEFATRWWPIIGHTAWSLLGNTSQAVAVTEEVLVAALRSAWQSEVPVRFAMYRLAIWLAIVRRRSSRRGARPETPMLEALECLNQVDRAALVLRDVEQVPVADAASILEIPAAEIRERVHRARISLVHQGAVLGSTVSWLLTPLPFVSPAVSSPAKK